MSVEASTPYIFAPTASVEFNKSMNSPSSSFSKIELERFCYTHFKAGIAPNEQSQVLLGELDAPS